MLQFGPFQNETAQCLLGKVLDQLYRGLPIKISGRKKSEYWHPLKNVFLEIEKVQTLDRLAHALHKILPETTLLYPRVGKFLKESFFPLVCGIPDVWAWQQEYDENDVLDTNKLPQIVADEKSLIVQSNDLVIDAMLPVIVERTFTVFDLVDEIINHDKELSNHKNELLAISIAWRGEYTLSFFGAVGEIALRSLWILPLLKNFICHPTLVILRQIKRDQDWKNTFNYKSKLWRERSNLVRIDDDRIYAPFMPKVGQSVLNLLKGLLFLGRLKWRPSENVGAQEALEKLIFSIVPSNLAKITTDQNVGKLEPSHSLQLLLNATEIIKTQEQLSSALDRILPEIAKFDLEAANLIVQKYLPLLDITYSETFPTPEGGQDKPKPPSVKKKRPTSTKTRQLRVNIPADNDKSEDGESIEETAQSISVLRRSEPSQQVIPLKEEIRWVHQRIYGANQLLLRNHIESLSDAEAFLFARALDARMVEAIAAKDAETGWLCILLALTMITGQGIATWTSIGICLNDAGKNFQVKPHFLLNEGILRLPVVRPDGAFKPKDNIMRSMLEATTQTVDLHLPPTLRCWIKSLLGIEKPNWSNNEQELKNSLADLVSAFRSHLCG